MFETFQRDIWNWDIIFMAGLQMAGMCFGLLLVGLLLKSYCAYVMGKKDDG